METIEKAKLINAGNHLVSIGTHDVREVAIISKYTGDFVKISDIKKGGKLRKVKRKFKIYLNSEDTLTFSHMQPDTTKELIAFLKK